MIKTYIKLLFILLTCLYCYGIEAQQKSFRRHFIIAYDVSGPFIKDEKNCPAYYQALVNLFSNRLIYGFNEGYSNNLKIETKNGVKFFDSDKDEISFFHFNIAESEFDNLRFTPKDSVAQVFNNLFLKDKNIDWTNYKNTLGGNAVDYIKRILAVQPTPSVFNNGVSMSNFVYPLILDKIDTTTYANEYILILLSDFKTGSMLGNTKDLERVRDIFHVIYDAPLSPTSSVGAIKNNIDLLNSQYYKLDFFQYSFNTNGKENAIAIIGYKVKPKIGVLTPEDVALFVDGNLTLNQKGYQSQKFEINRIGIKFSHNKNLVPTELKMSIYIPERKKNKLIFEDIIAENKSGAWLSKYTEDDNLMNFNINVLSYNLPKLKITVDSLINKQSFDNLKVVFEFKAKYTTGNSRPLNFIYATEKSIPYDNISYSTKATIIIMYFLIPLLLLISLAIFLILHGCPQNINLYLGGYLDSYEIIDYKTVGKLHTPYKAWDSDKQKVDHLVVKGELRYKSGGFPFNWNSYIHLKLGDVSIPPGFEIYLKHDTENIKEFAAGNAMTIKKEKNNKFNFVVGIRQNDILKKITNPELVKFKIEAEVKDSFLFIKSELRETLDYNFHIGQNLNDVWVGFDPGTSGSCVAVGSSTDNIILGKFSGTGETIIDSKIVIETDKPLDTENDTISNELILYGIHARTKFGNSNVKSLQSIKKMLGYKDLIEVKFKNGKSVNLSGKDLAGFIVRGLQRDLTLTVENEVPNADDYKREGEFNPQRAVIAIPNNFTISKIQDIVDCVGTLNQFKEIRYIYEAEAVLFYYLSNFQRVSEREKSSDSETVLIFDMGGATINATVVTTNRTSINNRAKYEIDFLGKIGYGIGGDTIDYCLSKFILSFSEEFVQLKGLNIFDKKIALASLSLQLKKEIILNYYKKNDYLITAYNLEYYINFHLNISIVIDTEVSEMYSYFKKVSGKFKLFEHPLFIKTIYNNVKDAVKEVVELANGTLIDKVIFSGRSTAFPMIKETVEKQLKSKEAITKSIVLALEESKTAVASGACWYGINKNSVILNNLKTNASFGFKKTLSADKTDVEFYELVGMGCTFDSTTGGIDSFKGSKNISDDFAFDGTKVNFYQVMGKDADTILAEGQKHKFSKIASIALDQVTSQIGMIVNENDEVDCLVKLESNRVISEKGVVSDQEIDEANEEHYTWIVK